MDSLETLKNKMVTRRLHKVCRTDEDYINEQVKHQLSQLFDEAYKLGLESGWALDLELNKTDA